MVDREGGPGAGDASVESDGMIIPAKPTELDLSAIAAAAVQAAQQPAISSPPAEHGTVISLPPADAAPALVKRLASGFAPTAFHAEMTSDTPSGAAGPPVIEELPEGTLLAGRYHLSHMVGHGGMGTVYASHDDDLDEDIALKVLRTDLARDAEFKRR